ncbi:MAG: tRNA pseudouridine38-40 synthase [Archaeoglobi archaeon]|nr:tRNA pseudouridine38-40 synthase [Archaeoglobi archaeon]
MFAFRVAYIGTDYHGFQIQPRVRTVEGEILRALKRLGIVKDKKSSSFSYASRTDAGVHALSQVVAFRTDSNLAEPRIINSELPEDIRFYARAEAPENFNARRDALYKRYRYYLYSEDLDIKEMREASRLFIGKHDFRNFSSERKKDTVRTVYSLEIRLEPPFAIIDICADSFLYNMARKIITALKMVGEGERPKEWISELLSLSSSEGIPPAPPQGLILEEVRYENLDFVVDEYALKSAVGIMKSRFASLAPLAESIRDMENSLESMKITAASHESSDI